MKKTLLIIFTGIIFFEAGCSKIDSNEVQIRIKNISAFDFIDVIVNTSGGENNYGNIISNQYSDYKTYDFAYRYAFVELKIDGNILILQPTDYVGEEKLNQGRYTYEINANEAGTQYEGLTLSLIED